jgi:hypothetical protein
VPPVYGTATKITKSTGAVLAASKAFNTEITEITEDFLGPQAGGF